MDKKVNNNCKIEFEVKDFLEHDMRYFEKKAINIACIVYNNPKLLNVLKEFLLSFINNIDFDIRYKKWKNQLPELQLLHGQAVLDDFLNELYSSFKSIKPYHIDKFRGLIFENLLEIHYKNLYSKDCDRTCFGCMVIINGKDIVYNCKENPTNNRKTVDIVGYNIKNSKFYELKVGPKGFDSHVINYLNILENELDRNKVSENIIVGCMTLELKSTLKMILKSNKVNFNKLELNGFKEIQNMLM